MHDWVTEAARARPDHTAVEAPDGAVTYSELDEAVDRCARRLAALGVREGDRVATALPPSLRFCELVHALPRLGAALVPLNTRLPAAEQRLQARVAKALFTVDRALDGMEAEIDPRPELDPAAVHTVLFTSGTSGAAKPVALTVANQDASAAASAAAIGSERSDRWLCPLPLFHIGGLAILVRCARAQTTVVLHERFSADRVIAALSDDAISLASLVPTMLRRLRDAGLDDAPALRALILGGGPISPDLLDWAREAGIAVRCTYGMTETCSQVLVTEPWEPAGLPVRGAELQTGAEGEILIRGEMVAPGALAADGWLHTGDRGRLDRRGHLHVEGRLGDLIISGGEKVSPPAVEAVLLAHPAIEDAAVAGTPSREWGEAVTAFVVEREPVADYDLLAFCREHLAGYQVPKRFERVDRLPRNAAGKLLRTPTRDAGGSGGVSPPFALESGAVIYDQDADLGKLDGKTVAILGYGSQGHAHALNLKESGVDVVVGLREDSASVGKAEGDGLEVVSVAEAASRGDVVMILLPDEKQAEIWEAEISDGIAPGNLLMFAHGFSIHYDQIAPSAGVDVGMVAPKAPGHLVRRQFSAGNGVPGLVAIHADESGTARELTLAYAKGIGCTRAGVIETTFKEETETDLFGEQAVLCGGVTELVRAGYETLVEAGYDPRLAYFECLHELKLIVDLMYEKGITGMRYSISNTAEYGDLTRGERVIGEPTRAAMKQILAEIQSGDFAREWIAENRAGQENFLRMREEGSRHQVEREGKELRSMMDWIDTEF